MAQITVTHESKDQQKVTFEIAKNGVCVHWPNIIGGDEGIFATWEDMESPEYLCSLFGSMRVEHFVQLAKWLAEAYQKRDLYQQVVW